MDSRRQPQSNDSGLTSRVNDNWIAVSGHSGNAPGQGPFLDLMLHLAEGRIREATYATYQCPGAHACGEAICEMIRGKTLEEVGKITHPMLVERVGPLPPHRRACYGLALLALHDALGQPEIKMPCGPT